MIVAYEFKWHIAGDCIFGIIIGKFGHWQKSGSIILLKVDKKEKIGLHYIILTICLSINLRVKRSKEPSFDLKEKAK